AQFNYFFSVDNWHGRTAAQQEYFWDTLGVSVDDRGHASNDPNVLYAPLTAEMVAKLQAMSDVNWIEKVSTEPDALLYPHDYARDMGWTLDNYGPVTIPQKGMTIELNDSTWAMYGRCIRNYEFNDAELRDGKVYIDGKPAESYTFQMDYYFMMGDNRHNSLDSRFWGFVPEDHIVGKPMVVLASFDKDRGMFDGGIRWNRILRSANPDK
ncbi:MAG: signal peptidase I, partial [Muribaculaceae bacterium]|nr:signal peptidase I [Muribaculaceae bacterium]